MARPKKCRRVCGVPRVCRFLPENGGGEPVTMTVDELECIRLLDLEGLTQEQCAAQMMDWRAVPSYAYNDFWRAKPLYIRWLYRLSSYVITPFSVCIFNNAHTIPVYHDSRIMTTFHQTLDALSDNAKVIIFPECAEPHNHIVNQFQNRFIDVARTYYNRTGKRLSFVPMYIAPRLKTARLGHAVTFDPDRPLAQERQRICDCLMEAITAMAEQMPLHTVVPNDNIPTKRYHTNRPDQETSHEKTNR